MPYCKNCNRRRPNEKFWVREDRQGFYSWCIDCCNSQGRSLDYPDRRVRGSGVIKPNYASLEPGYSETDYYD